MDVYQIITNRIIEALEKNDVPWKRTWDARTQAPRNLLTGKLYSGINVFLLASQRYQSPYWLTFKQAQERGGAVKPGEKGTPIIYFNTREIEGDDGETKKSGYLRYYTVFNVSQCQDLKDVPELETQIKAEGFDRFNAAKRLDELMQQRPTVRYGFSRACYIPAKDEVNMPVFTSFNSGEEFYSTLFHELTHSTGHERRLDRKGMKEFTHFGDSEYSKEELVAEFGSAFLCAEAGISPAVIDNQTAYIAGWLKALKNDSKLLISAAAQAQKAVDYITGKTA